MNSDSDFKDNLNERSFLRVSIYMLTSDSIIDLLSPGNPKHSMEKRGIQVESFIDKNNYEFCTRVVGLSERLIATSENFNHLLQDAFQERSNLASRLDDLDIRKRSHLIIGLNLVKRDTKGLVT